MATTHRSLPAPSGQSTSNPTDAAISAAIARIASVEVETATLLDEIQVHTELPPTFVRDLHTRHERALNREQLTEPDVRELRRLLTERVQIAEETLTLSNNCFRHDPSSSLVIAVDRLASATAMARNLLNELGGRRRLRHRR